MASTVLSGITIYTSQQLTLQELQRRSGRRSTSELVRLCIDIASKHLDQEEFLYEDE